MTRAKHAHRIATPLLAALLAPLLTFSGCDKQPKVSYNIPAEPTPATGPTTQSIVSWPRKTLSLGSFPMTIDVPDTWDLTTTEAGPDTLFSIDGLAPAGDVSIELTTQSPCTAQVADAMISARLQKRADSILMVSSRPLGEAKLLEWRTLQHHDVPPTADPDILAAANTVQWTVMVFTPHRRDAKFTPCVLSVFHMTKREYNMDKEFLGNIFASLKYDPSVGLQD